MAATIPDNDLAPTANQARVYQATLDALVAAVGGTGVVSGLACTAVTSNMVVTIASGVVVSGGRRWAVSGTTKTIGAAHASNPRIDLIVVDSSGAVQTRAGTAAASPKEPALTAGDVLLCQVYVPATVTVLTTATHVTDRRFLIPDPNANVIYASTFGVSAAAAAGTNRAALQAAIDYLVAGGSGVPATLVLPPGTIQIDDEITLGALLGKTIMGTGYYATNVQQTTTNKAVFCFDTDGAAYNAIQNLKISHSSAQSSSNTNAYGIAFTVSGSTTQGVFRNVFDKLHIANFFRGIGVRKASGYCTVWGNTFGHLDILDSTGASLYISNPSQVGQPETVIVNLYCQNYTATNTEAMVILQNVEATILHLGLEDGEDGGIKLTGNEFVDIRELHVERHTFSTTNARLVETSTGRCSIGHLRFKGTIATGGGNDAYLFVPAGDLKLESLYTEVTNTSGTLSVFASGSGSIRGPEHWVENGGTIGLYPSWDTGLPDLLRNVRNGVWKRWYGSSNYNNSNAENVFSPTVVFPANFLKPNMVIRVRARGVYGTTSTPNLTLKLKFGTTVICSTGANAAGTGVTNRGWSLECDLVVVDIGASGHVEGQGQAIISTSALAAAICDMENTATVAIDTTGSLTLQISEQWSATGAANTITLRELIVEVL